VTKPWSLFLYSVVTFYNLCNMINYLD